MSRLAHRFRASPRSTAGRWRPAAVPQPVARDPSPAITELVATISHELRTPLQSILGYSELGQMRASHQPALAAMFKDVNQAGQRMLALVNDLLDVAKIESPTGALRLERVDLRPWVRAVLHELQPLLDAKRLRIEAGLGPLPLPVRADGPRLQQVLRNLLANAIRFSPAGATIELRGESLGGAGIALAVTDRGPGVPADELERIFEAFVQSGRADASHLGGTGLGLAISRKIVQAHGGRIWAENRPGGGSCFRVCLPACGEDVPPETSTSGVSSSGSDTTPAERVE